MIPFIFRTCSIRNILFFILFFLCSPSSISKTEHYPPAELDCDFFLAFEEYTNVLSWRNWGLSAYPALSTSLPLAKKASLPPCASVRVKFIQQTCTEHQSESGTVLWPKGGGKWSSRGSPAPVILAYTQATFTITLVLKTLPTCMAETSSTPWYLIHTEVCIS